MSLARINELSATVLDSSGPLNPTTGSFTPADNSLLVAHVGLSNGADGGDVRTGMTLSGGGLTWTKRAGPNGGTVSNFTSCHEIWTAPVVTGASMTITYSHAGERGDTSTNFLIGVLSYTSDIGTAELGSVNIASGAHDQGDGAVSITLGSSPATESEVSASRYYSSNGNDGNATQGSGWTEIYDLLFGGGGGSLQLQIRGSSTSDNVAWVDVMTGSETAWNSSALAIEILEVSGALTASGTPTIDEITASGVASILSFEITDVNTTESWDDGDTGLVITGTGFL